MIGQELGIKIYGFVDITMRIVDVALRLFVRINYNVYKMRFLHTTDNFMMEIYHIRLCSVYIMT